MDWSWSALLWILCQTILSSSADPVKRNSRHICILPPHPKNGRWTIVNGNGQPGDEISQNTIVKFECNSSYKLISKSAYVICNNEYNLNRMPECGKLCPPLYSSSTTKLKCVNRNGDDVDCSEATDGTYLSYECISFYEAPLGYRKNLLCIDGIWNYPKPVCQPICGKKINDDYVATVYGGNVSKEIEYPWVAAVYKKLGDVNVNICGGTIISRRVVLTAAHCVTDDDGNMLPAESRVVGVGKLYNGYNDERDTKAQYIDLSNIIVHNEFKGESRNFFGDVALLITKNHIILTDVVQPVCISDVNNIYLHVGDVGEIAGWGVDESNRPAEKLRVLHIPYKYDTVCAMELPADWVKRYNLADKLCAGFLNMNRSICPGDSGSGLVFKNAEDNRYYVHGIASLAPGSKGICNIQQNSLYTKVTYHFNFIDKELSKTLLEECKLPPYPEHGIWKLEDGKNKSPGDWASSTTMLKISCNKQYKPSGNPSITCDMAFDMPSCEKLCPPVVIPPDVSVICKSRTNRLIDCTDMTEGSYFTYSCPAGHTTLPSGGKPLRHCTGGVWNDNGPLCLKEGTNVTLSTVKPTVEILSPTKVICTYASWAAYKGVEPEFLDPFLCTHLVYAFAGLWSNGDMRVQDDYLDLNKGGNKGLYRRTTDLKLKNPKLKVMLAIGGSKASNSSIFSEVCKDPKKTDQFIKSTMHFLKIYNFDGLDIDWPYPYPEPKDKDNYISFLQSTRNALKKEGYLLSATVAGYPDDKGFDGNRMNQILDWVTVKSFDFYGAWSSYTGQHNPLYFSSKEFVWERNHLNLAAAAVNWMNAGISEEKLVLTVAFFGKTFILKDEKQHALRSPVEGAGPGEGEGFLRYSEICLNYEDYTSVWDDEQKMEYKYKGKVWIGCPNKDSVWIKGEYVRKKGFFGVNVYPVDGEDVLGKCGRKQQLLKHLHGGLGNKVNWEI